MTSTTSQVLRLPRSDEAEESPFVLVHVKPGPSKLLDVRLVGTDGLEPYVVSLKHDRIPQYKAHNSNLDDNEWEEVLASVLLSRTCSSSAAAGIEVVATVENGDCLTIHIRKQVQGITQRLGTIKLPHKPSEDISLFDWCAVISDNCSALKSREAATDQRIHELEDLVQGLKDQLNEFIAAKESDEGELLEKFKALLNEKKLKIREQQSIINAAANNPALLSGARATEEVEPPRVKEESVDGDDVGGRESAADGVTLSRARRGIPSTWGKGGPSTRAPARGGKGKKPVRTAKRKIAEVEEEGEEDDDDDGFDGNNHNKMEVDGKQQQQQPLQDEENKNLESTTTDEDQLTEDDEEASDEPDSNKEVDVAAAAAGRPHTARGSQSQPDNREASSSVFKAEELEPPPPRRQLPFAKSSTRGTAPSSRSTTNARGAMAVMPAGIDSDEEASSDDEL